MDETDLREALRTEAERHAFDPATVGRAVERGRTRRRRRRTALVAAVPVVALVAAGGVLAVSARLPAEPPVAAQPLQLLTQRTQSQNTMLTNASGTVAVAENGCLSLDRGSAPLTPVAWPADWTAAVDEEGIAALYDADGVRRFREGDEVRFAGGYVPVDDRWEPVAGPAECALGQSDVFHTQGPIEVLRQAQTG